MKLTKNQQRKLNNYPRSFHSFKDGVEVDDETIKKWLIECGERLNVRNNFSFSGSGDTIVFALRCGPDDEGKYEIFYYVSKKYEELSMIVDLDKLNKPKNFFEYIEHESV